MHTAIVRGISVGVLIDSGSEISLIKGSLVRQIKGELRATYILLRGIADQEMETTARTTHTIKFPEISIETDLHIVPDQWMDTPILQGTDRRPKSRKNNLHPDG